MRGLQSSTDRMRRPTKVLMWVENNFPQDTRVANEARLLADAGYEVAVIALRKQRQTARETWNGIEIYRVPTLELFKKTVAGNGSRLNLLFVRLKSFLGYVVEYLYFTSACFLVSTYIFVRRGFDVMHAHNPPDTLFLAAMPFKLLGKKFVFDQHDLCPELYRSRYSAGEGFYTRFLRLFEWCSLKLADVTIATNESYKQIQIERANKNPARYLRCKEWAEPDANDSGRAERPSERNEQVHSMLCRQPKSTRRCRLPACVRCAIYCMV